MCSTGLKFYANTKKEVALCEKGATLSLALLRLFFRNIPHVLFARNRLPHSIFIMFMSEMISHVGLINCLIEGICLKLI
jgi:hypothetical protein